MMDDAAPTDDLHRRVSNRRLLMLELEALAAKYRYQGPSTLLAKLERFIQDNE